MHSGAFGQFFDDWPGPWEFANAEVTADRLKQAGFVDIETSLEEAPTTLATEADYREFVTTVIYHPHLERLPDPALKQAFIDRVTELAAQEPVPFCPTHLLEQAFLVELGQERDVAIDSEPVLQHGASGSNVTEPGATKLAGGVLR